MPDDLAQALQSWMSRMERQLRGLRDAGEDTTLRDTLDALSKQIHAWQILYEPPPEPPTMIDTALMPRGFRARTIGGNN